MIRDYFCEIVDRLILSGLNETDSIVLLGKAIEENKESLKVLFSYLDEEEHEEIVH